MPPSQGIRAGMAIIRIEIGDDAGRLLIRITTVEDITEREPAGRGAPFADPQAALEYLGAWLEQWIAPDVRRDG
jgi:hypothetical protein